ncbi:MAG TPA: succinate dehydrogenase cytochrome b subunit [Streptosporangiales bacterium]
MTATLERRVGETTVRRPGPMEFWRTSVGKKAVMAVTGAVLLLYLFAHMLGNLKIYFGAAAFDHYAHWLRTIGEPLLPYGWFLWLLRGVLTVSVVLHIVAAAQLTARSRAARRGRGSARRLRVPGTYATRTMRWGGVVIALFVVYHILDITLGTLNPDYLAGHVYHNVTADFRYWFVAAFYTVAMAALALHIRHGVWSATQTLGLAGTRERVLRAASTAVAVVICGGFVVVPWSILLGFVR